MKKQLKGALGSLAVVVALAGFSQASTITFTGHSSNADIEDADGSNTGTYGSNIAGETTDFITTDGTGATPNIGLYWETAAGFDSGVWEFHNSSTFALLDPGTTGTPPRPTGIGQLDVNAQSGNLPADPTIDFIPEPGWSVAINSFIIGHATDMTEADNAWEITLTRVSDDAQVWVHNTAEMGAGENEAVTVNFIGDPGEQYKMRFDDGGADHVRGGIDNLSFSQVPEPSTLVLLLFGAMAPFAIRRQR